MSALLFALSCALIAADRAPDCEAPASLAQDLACADQDIALQCAALVALDANLGGGVWPLGGGSFCTWPGVLCDLDGHVISLTIRDLEKGGQLPTELIFLEKLERLSITNSSIVGAVPELSASLVELYLAENKLTGVLPAVSRLPKLNALHLDGNQLRGGLGPLLSALPHSLRRLGLSRNQFEGRLPAAALSRFRELEVLRLGGNSRLTGTLSSLPALRVLSIDGTGIDTLDESAKLQSLDATSARNLKGLIVLEAGYHDTIRAAGSGLDFVGSPPKRAFHGQGQWSPQTDDHPEEAALALETAIPGSLGAELSPPPDNDDQPAPKKNKGARPRPKFSRDDERHTRRDKQRSQERIEKHGKERRARLLAEWLNKTESRLGTPGDDHHTTPPEEDDTHSAKRRRGNTHRASAKPSRGKRPEAPTVHAETLRTNQRPLNARDDVKNDKDKNGIHSAAADRATPPRLNSRGRRPRASLEELISSAKEPVRRQPDESIPREHSKRRTFDDTVKQSTPQGAERISMQESPQQKLGGANPRFPSHEDTRGRRRSLEHKTRHTAEQRNSEDTTKRRQARNFLEEKRDRGARTGSAHESNPDLDQSVQPEPIQTSQVRENHAKKLEQTTHATRESAAASNSIHNRKEYVPKPVEAKASAGHTATAHELKTRTTDGQVRHSPGIGGEYKKRFQEAKTAHVSRLEQRAQKSRQDGQESKSSQLETLEKPQNRDKVREPRRGDRQPERRASRRAPAGKSGPELRQQADPPAPLAPSAPSEIRNMAERTSLHDHRKGGVQELIRGRLSAVLADISNSLNSGATQAREQRPADLDNVEHESPLGAGKQSKNSRSEESTLSHRHNKEIASSQREGVQRRVLERRELRDAPKEARQGERMAERKSSKVPLAGGMGRDFSREADAIAANYRDKVPSSAQKTTTNTPRSPKLTQHRDFAEVERLAGNNRLEDDDTEVQVDEFKKQMHDRLQEAKRRADKLRVTPPSKS